MTASPAAQHIIRQAVQQLQTGDTATADRLLTPLANPIAGPTDPEVLYLLGTIRLGQQRFDNAASLLLRCRSAQPRRYEAALNLARALSRLGRTGEATAAFRDAIKLKPDLAEPYLELGYVLHVSGQLEEAESIYRKLMRLKPGHAAVKLWLGAVLIDADRAADAETLLRRALQETIEPQLRGALHNTLAQALRRQNQLEEALEHFDHAAAHEPALPYLNMQRAEIFDDLKRHDQAVEMYRKVLAQEPRNPTAHQAYNDLLYRLGRTDEYLKSYDRAPRSRDLQLGKAFFLMHEKRGEEAHAIYRDLLKQDPGDKDAAAGAAKALMTMNRPEEAGMAFAAALARAPGHADLFADAAEAALRAGNFPKALALSERGLAAQPANQSCLAMMGTALRLMADERDEILNGYDTLIRAFDLEPPDGFSDMASFNAELCAALEQLHPNTREYVNQSLRGGTQTPAHLFGSGQILVDRLKTRLSETVARYIAELKVDENHPFLSRRARDFAYSGSWSSRLADCGFHINHLHPGGWISSCYYAGVPDAVADPDAKQGWIKFGEPVFDVGLSVRRAIQPAPGRLVLFPSYMWHGTIPFRGPSPRTTIAFDVIPK